MEVLIVVTATIIGIKIDQMERKVINRKNKATTIATSCPRCKSRSSIGDTSCLIAGGPETFAFSSPAALRAIRSWLVKSAAFEGYKGFGSLHRERHLLRDFAPHEVPALLQQLD